jgi:beta-glucanase (GH16 family)
MVLAAAANLARAQTWQITFDDEFNGTHVDTAKWTYGLPWGNLVDPTLDMSAYNESNPGTNNANVSESGGYLYLTATHTPYPAEDRTNHKAPITQPYTAAVLTTVEKFTQTYGKFETRAKLAVGQGLHQGFWLLNAVTHGPPELDVFENIGQSPNKLFMTDHYDPDNTHKSVQGKFIGPDFSADFHNYSLVWTPATVNWYVDDQLKYSATNTLGNQVSPTQPMNVLLNMTVRGPRSWPGAPDASTVFPASMVVDYVRVYKAAPATQPSAAPAP